MNKKTFNLLLEQLKNEKLAIYIGSGFSVGCGLPNWTGLIEPLAKEIHIDLNNQEYKDLSLMQIAQYYQNKYGRDEINKLLKNNFGSKGKIDLNHELLPQVGFTELWTTNYDPYIEEGYKKQKKNLLKKIKQNDLDEDKKTMAPSLYKIHGDYKTPEDCIVTQTDYEDFTETHEYFINKLKDSLIQKTFLFVGFSFTDPDIKYSLAEIRRSGIKDSNNKHYIILNETEYKTKDQKNKFHLFCKDLKQNYNISPIIIKDFMEITDLFNDLIKYRKRETVFISGATIDEDDSINTQREQFVSNLAKQLIKSGLNISSGYGLGVGEYVISGALREIYDNNFSVSKKLLLHPFPQNITNSVLRKNLWTQYRTDMCQESGIEIIIYGYKYKDKKNPDKGIENSSGVKEEFSIGKDQNLFIIPVGITKYAAEEIWNEMEKNLENFGYTTDSLKKAFYQLNTELEDKQLIETIVRIINEVKQK